MLNNLLGSKCFGYSAVALLAASVVLTGCGGGGGAGGETGGTTTTGGGTSTTTTTATVGGLSLGTSVSSIKTNGTDKATITAVVTDSSKAALKDVEVTFSTTGGLISSSKVKTDAEGKATVTLENGSDDYSNRTVNITASTGSFTKTIPVAINGSTLTLATSTGSAQVGTDTITFSATAKDATPTGRFGQTVRFSVGAGSTGSGTFSTSSTTTDTVGVTPSVTFTPTVAGKVILTADWLVSSGAVSVQTTQDINVTAAAGVSFAVSSPATNPHSMSTGGTQVVAVSVPTSISGVTVQSVRFSSTSGTWSSSSVSPVVSNAASSTFTAPSNSGNVTIQVDALDTSNNVLSSLNRQFAVSATVPAKIELQSSVSSLSPSTATVSSTAALTATVWDSLNNSVGSAPVKFELLGTTGSGESLSPALVNTNSAGQAAATLTAATVSTQGSIYVRASVNGTSCTGSPHLTPPVAETNPMCSSIPLNIAATAGGVSLGIGTTVGENSNKTQYILPASVQVVDGNGGAVKNAIVSLSVFPSYYRNGSITVGPKGCVAPTTTPVANEDVNRNLILNAGEDATGTPAQVAAGAKVNNGIISPPRPSSGSLPQTVTTDDKGAAIFDLQYLKESAYFIVAEVTATVKVSGTEQSAKAEFMLPASETDAGVPDKCPIARTADY